MCVGLMGVKVERRCNVVHYLLLFEDFEEDETVVVWFGVRSTSLQDLDTQTALLQPQNRRCGDELEMRTR